MKTIEAILPLTSVEPAIHELYTLDVEEVTVETIKVFKKDLHRKMIHRGCAYEENFVIESKLHFRVSDENAARAETIIAVAPRS